jgi:hypothetical protein
VEALNAGRASLRYAFRPLVVDTFGAWDSRALDVFRRIASAWGRRAASRRSSAILSFAVARGVARILLCSAAPDLPRLDRDPAGSWQRSAVDTGAAGDDVAPVGVAGDEELVDMLLGVVD